MIKQMSVTDGGFVGYDLWTVDQEGSSGVLQDVLEHSGHRGHPDRRLLRYLQHLSHVGGRQQA